MPRGGMGLWTERDILRVCRQQGTCPPAEIHTIYAVERTVRLTLPFPPSGNKRLAPTRNGRLIRRQATRDYIRHAEHAILTQHQGQGTLVGHLHVLLELHEPTLRRERDVDGFGKDILDCLQRTRVIANDALIDHLEYKWSVPSDPAYVEVCIEPLPPP